MTLKPQHCALDLDDYVRALRSRLHENTEAIREIAKLGTLSETQEARFAVGRGMLIDFINDLEELAEAWRSGHPGRRATEELLED